MKAPSKDWEEIIADDEKARFARQAESIPAVPAGLSEPLSHGAFARPGEHKALVRLSHGSFDMQANTKPDIRGFAFKVLGLSGPSSLGGTTDQQDFLLINHDSFASRTSDEFLEITTAATKGPVAYEVAVQFFVDEAVTPIENPPAVTKVSVFREPERL